MVSRRESNRRYYLNKVKPKRTPKSKLVTKLMFMCPFCRKSSSPSCFNNPFETRLGVLVYHGYKGIQYQNATFLSPIYTAKAVDFMEAMSKRAVDFLQMAIGQGLISKEYVAYVLNFITPEKLEEVKQIWQIPPTIKDVSSITLGGNVWSGQLLATLQSFQSAKVQRAVTPNLLRSPAKI